MDIFTLLVTFFPMSIFILLTPVDASSTNSVWTNRVFLMSLCHFAIGLIIYINIPSKTLDVNVIISLLILSYLLALDYKFGFLNRIQ